MIACCRCIVAIATISYAGANARVRDDASGVCAVCLLAGIAEVSALPVAGGVDVLMAWLWVSLHCFVLVLNEAWSGD